LIATSQPAVFRCATSTPPVHARTHHHLVSV